MTKEAAEELEEMGEDTSDMIMSQSKMREMIMNATKVASNKYKGVDIQDEIGNYKSTFQILSEIGSIWDEIKQADLRTGDNRQNLLLEAMAGKNRANTLASVLMNNDILQSAYQDSKYNAAGKATEELEKVSQGIEYHLTQLTNSWQQLWSNVANREIINFFIDLAKAVLDFVNNVGAIPTALSALTTGVVVKGLISKDSLLVQLFKGFLGGSGGSNDGQDIGDIIASKFEGGAQISKMFEARTKATVKDTAANMANAASIEAQNAALKQQSGQLGTNTAAQIAETATNEADTTADLANASAEEILAAAHGLSGAGAAGGGALATGGLSAGIGAIISNPALLVAAIAAIGAVLTLVHSASEQAKQALIDTAHEATETWEGAKESVENYTQKYKELNAQLENPNLSEKETIEIKKQIYDLQKEITNEYGNAAKGIDLVNGKLDEQLGKLREINTSNARDNLRDNRDAYMNAKQQMEMMRNMSVPIGIDKNKASEIQNIIDKAGLKLTIGEADLGGIAGDQSGYKGYEIQFNGTAIEADEQLKALAEELNNLKESMGDNWDISGLSNVLTSVDSTIKANQKTLDTYKADYLSYLEQTLYSLSDPTGKNAFFDYMEATEKYNEALTIGDTSQIKEAKKAFEEATKAKDDFLKNSDQDFTELFKPIDDALDKTAVEVYETQQKINDPKVKNVVESVFGTPKDIKKSAENIPKQFREIAQDILDEQAKAREWGLTPYGVDPLSGIGLESQFGNINMDERPIIKWSEEYKKKFADALASWNYNPEIGSIDTVFGGSDYFNGLEIAFTPILATEDGKVEDFMSYDAVHEYIQDLVEKATDEDGNIDAQLILDMDAGKVKDVVGKQIIGAVDGVGKYTANVVGKMMHFSGTKGAIYLDMQKLSEYAQQAGLDVDEVLEKLRSAGEVDALAGIFDDFKYDIADVEYYLGDLENLPYDVADDILAIADAFGITADSSQESINAVAQVLGSMGYIAADSIDLAGESFDQFALKASGWIEGTNNLSSVLAKGQGTLTYTKTQDDQGHEVASEVKALVDAYKELPGYNYGELFEETSVGIMVNAEALRALQSQEESMRSMEFLEEREKLMQQYNNTTGEVAENYKRQIEELDMLYSAYLGATSALSKYQNGHGAADYSTNYKLFRDQIFKEGDAYLESGEIGEEGFRRVAQLFSYKDLALASVDEVVEAYQNGADTMQKFFTEDPTKGTNLWIDEIMSWPEEYAKIVTDESGQTIMTMTDENLDAVAKQYGVSKDLIVSLMNEMNATGSRVHFFTDGQMQEFDVLAQRATDAQKRLSELQTTATDPNLNLSDALSFDLSDLNTFDEISEKIESVQKLRDAINPDVEPEAAKALDDLLTALNEKLEIINGKQIEPKLTADVDGLNQAEESLGVVNDRLAQIEHARELGIDIDVTEDPVLQEAAETIESWPPELKSALHIDPNASSEELLEQMKEWQHGDNNIPITLEYETDKKTDPEKTKKELESKPIKRSVEYEYKNDPGDAMQRGNNLKGYTITNTETTENVTKNVEETTTVAKADTSQATQGLTFLDGIVQDLNGKTFEVKGQADTKDAQQNLDNVDKKVDTLKKKNCTVSVWGNSSPFNKIADEVSRVINELGSKEPTTKFKGDASGAVNAANDAKEAIDDVPQSKKSTLTVVASGIDTIKNWYNNVFTNLKDKKITLTTTKVEKTVKQTVHTSGGGRQTVNFFRGTAHATGTVSHGHAYANGRTSGNWGLEDDENGALINEVGSEILVRDGQWHILNNGDPTFVNLKRGDIIFNHLQSRELLEKGQIKGSHGKLVGGSFANGVDPGIDESRLDELMGSAFTTGTAKWNGALSGFAHGAEAKIRRPQTYKRNNTTSGGGGGNNKTKSSGKRSRNGGGHHGSHRGSSSARSKAKAFLETLDAIEIQLNRVDAKISQLDTTIGQTFQTFGTRTNSVTKEFAQLNKEIKLVSNSLSAVKDPRTNYLQKAITAAQKAGYTEEEQKSYKESHNGTASPVEGRSGTPLSKGWIQDIQNSVKTGNYMTIEDVGDEGTWKKIQAYQTWYEKYFKLQQKKQEYVNKLSQLTITNLQLIQTKYSTTLDAITSVLNGNENLRQLQTFRTNGTTTSTKNKKTGKVTYGMNWKKDTVNGRYENDIKQYQEQIKTIQKERKELQTALDVGVKKGYIKKNSEEFRKWTTQIANLGNDIVAAQTKIGEAASNQIQHVQDRWENVLESLEGDLTGYTNKIEQFAFSTSANVFARTSVKSPATLRKEASKAKEKVGTTYDKYAKAKTEQQLAENVYRTANSEATLLEKKANKTGKASDRQKAEIAQIKAAQARNNLYQANNAVSTAYSAYSTAQKNLKTANDRVKRAGDNPATITTTAKSLSNFTAGNDLTLNYIGKEYTTNKKRIDYLNAEAKQLQSKLDDAVSKGRIQKGSEEWRKWQQQIKGVNNEIIETQTALDQLAVDGLEHIQERWETSINSLKDDFEGLESTIDGFRYSQSSREATNAKRSKLVNFNSSNDKTLAYLDKEVSNYKNQKARLEAEAKNLETYLNQAVARGQIKKGSQVWYEWQSNIKGVKNEIIEVTNSISEISVAKLEHIQDRWETTIKYLETITDRFKNYADLQSAKGYEVSAKYYQEQIKYNTNQLANMRQEAANLQSAFDSAVKSGRIAKYSAEWFKWYTEIEDIRNDIVGLQKDIVDLNNEIRQLTWDRFDRIQDAISDVIDEMEFLNGIIYENDLFDDNGKVTKKGMASAALIAQQFDLARRSADRYKTEILNINKEIAKDPYNQDLLKRRQELIKAQQESIENAQKQKQAMVDLAEKGIKKQIDAMNELISKYEEALDKQRQQEQYAKNMANQQKSIASLEKQLRSMRGDDSEEGRARRQQLEDQLKSARESLKDSQEDKRISDIKEALSELQERYQDVLNERLDNIDKLFAEAIDVINENGLTISNTIKSVANSVGYNMTDTLAKTYEGVKNTLVNGVNSLVSTINNKNGNLVNNSATTLKADQAIVNQENKAKEAANKEAANTIKAVTTTPRVTTTTTTTPRKDTSKATSASKANSKQPATTPKKDASAAKKTTTTTPDPKKVAIKNATNKYNNAKNATTQAQTQADNAKKAYNSAVTAQKNAQIALKNAQSILTNAQNTYNKSKTIANRNKLDQAKNSVSIAQARLSAINADVTSKQKALNSANTSLANAKNAQIAARNALEKLDPTKKNGLRTEGGEIYYYVKGVKQKGWQVISGNRYYFDPQGRAVRNRLLTLRGTTYYFGSNGKMATADVTIDGLKYKVLSNGKITQSEKNGKVIKKYAKGTKSVPKTDLYQVDEEGQEVFINSKGKIYTRLEKGTAVLPHEAAVNLLEGMSNPIGFIKDHMDLRPNKNITSTTTSGDTYNTVTFNMPNVTNYNEFMREAQRDPNFTKYIQEISLGKMNGNNSMKGRAVRFR